MSLEVDYEVFEKYYASRPWLKFYDKKAKGASIDVPEEISIPEYPLYKILDDAYNKDPNHVALIFMGKKITYRELHEDSERFARVLLDKFNFKKGDRLALFLPNTPHFPVAFFGCIKLGGIIVPINPLSTAREIAYVVRTSGARILIALDLLKDHVEGALKEVEVDAVIYAGIEDYLPPLKAFIYKSFMKKVKAPIDRVKRFSFKELMKGVEAKAPRAEINPKEDLVALMYTGGTTGIPKGAMLTHHNVLSNLYQIDAWYFQGRTKNRFVGLLPWFHIYGLTTVLLFGIFNLGTVVAFPRLNLKEVLEAIQKYKLNVFHGVPTIYSLINAFPEVKKYNIKSIEACISGAAPLPAAVARKFEELTGGKLREGYGLTETSPVTHVNPIDGRYKYGSIGLPIPNTMAAIADPEKPIFLPPNQVGEIVVAGPQVMKGYYNMPEENKMAFFEKYGYRWFRTGDLGYMDEEGYFYVVDRKKDLIKYKGYSVYPREVEEVLYAHEAVLDAAVIGVPDEKVGERVKAFIVLKDAYKGKIKEEDIVNYLKDKLAEYKIPKEIEFRDSLPKSAAGKILRRVLREEEVKKLGK